MVPADSHVITICDIPSRLPTSNVNGEADGKTEVTSSTCLVTRVVTTLMMATRNVEIAVAK